MNFLLSLGVLSLTVHFKLVDGQYTISVPLPLISTTIEVTLPSAPTDGIIPLTLPGGIPTIFSIPTFISVETGAPAATSASQSTHSSLSAVTSAHSSSAAASSMQSSASMSASHSAPYTPSGGWDTAGDDTYYHPLGDFDFQSVNLMLNQEYLELELFYSALRNFSVQDFQAAGLSEADRELVLYMADQETGHIQLLSEIIGSESAKPCKYQFPFTTIHEFIDFSQKLTSVGESGVIGFLEHLMSRPMAERLIETLVVESRQQMMFRLFERLFPMPVWFETGITQSMAWSWIAPYIVECPSSNPRITWQNFPVLRITNNPNATAHFNNSDDSYDSDTAHHHHNPLSTPGREVFLTWDDPGEIVGYNDSYTTSTCAGTAQYAAWMSQLQTVFTPLNNVSGNSASTTQPSGGVFGNGSVPIINGTVFVVITDNNDYLETYNLSKINPHVVAGPALYQAG